MCSTTESAIARMMPCSTPDDHDHEGGDRGDRELAGPQAWIERMPGTSMSSTPMRKTTAASTALGMYESGLVRNSSTTSHDGGAR